MKRLERPAQVACWSVVTVVLLPPWLAFMAVVYVLWRASQLFERLARASDKACEGIAGARDKVAPYPLPTKEQAEALEAKANEDL